MNKSSQQDIERPESSQDNQEVKELVRQTLFGNSFEKWKKIFPEEVNDGVDKELLVDKYMGSIGDDVDLSPEELGEKINEFSGRLSTYSEILAKSDIYPFFYRDAFHEWVKGSDLFKDKETFSSFIWNHTLRSREKIEEAPARMKHRFEKQPLADEDEYNAGVYREELEPQMSDAIFLLRKKGYDTFQSGFNDLSKGSQFIDFCTEDSENESEYLQSLFSSDEVKRLFEEINIKFDVKKSDDRLTIHLFPDDPHKSLEQWKNIWDAFASIVPDRGHGALPPVRLGSYETFIERQTKMRNGERTYLGYGVEFDGVRAVKRTVKQ